MTGVKISKDIWLKAEKMKKDGVSNRQIAKALKISCSAVGYHFNAESRKKHNIWNKNHPVPTPTRRFGYTPEKYDLRKKMLSSDWKKAKKMRENGATYKMIADHFGISMSVICYYFNPESRKKHSTWQKEYNKDHYSKEKSLESIKKWYNRKKKLFKEGKTYFKKEN